MPLARNGNTGAPISDSAIDSKRSRSDRLTGVLIIIMGMY
jgi:hypothetical protein